MINKNKQLLPSNKTFGLFFSLIFFLVFIWLVIYNESFSILFISLSILFLVLAFFKPSYLYVLNFFWYKFGRFLQFLFTPIIMFLTFFLLITPISILMRIFSRKQLMNLNFKKKSNSYWIYEKADKKLNMKDPF
jgi:hypothetical protein